MGYGLPICLSVKLEKVSFSPISLEVQLIINVIFFIHRTKIDDVLATGGRYDALVRSFQNALVNRRRVDGEPMSQQTVVGGLIHLDRIAAILKECEVVEERVLVYAAIYSIGCRPQTKEQASLVKDLWNNGVRATVLDHCQVF